MSRGPHTSSATPNPNRPADRNRLQVIRWPAPRPGNAIVGPAGHANRRRVETGGWSHASADEALAEQELEAGEVGHIFTSNRTILARPTKRQATTVETPVRWLAVAGSFGLATFLLRSLVSRMGRWGLVFRGEGWCSTVLTANLPTSGQIGNLWSNRLVHDGCHPAHPRVCFWRL